MTELREPPLLSGFKSYSVIFLEAKRKYIASRSQYDKHTEEAGVAEGCKAIAQAQREADIKWMKENCYLKAERELPDSPWAKQADNGDMHARSRTSGYYCCQQDMLKEVDGVAYRACKEFGK